MAKSMAEASRDIYHGRLGRTSKTSVLISSRSGPVFPASVYTCVNVTQEPELREKLDERTLNRATSPFDDQDQYDLSIVVRYHDEQRRLFAILIPETLRHEEFRHRSEFLQELAKEREILPDYVRHFHTLFSMDELRALEQRLSSQESAQVGDVTADLAAPSLPSPPVAPQHDEQLAAERAEVEAAQQEIATQRSQLDALGARFERERERMDEVEQRITDERTQLEDERAQLSRLREQMEAERQRLEAERLNLEATQRDLHSVPEEKTQIVTDDQFIEIVSEDDSSTGTTVEIDAELVLDESEILEEQPDPLTHDDAPQAVPTPPPAESSEEGFEVPDSFDDSLANGLDAFALVTEDGHVLASARTTRRAAERVVDGDPALFVQYALIEQWPMISILLATLDDQRQLSSSFAWPLDVSHDRDRAVIEALTTRATVRFAFYDRKGRLLSTHQASAPIEPNVSWILARAKDCLAHADPLSRGSFGAATATFSSDDYEHLGTMRHNFSRDSFSPIENASSAKLAAGIVGYWSGPDVFEYLIANRSFPLDDFRAIQQRVARAAVERGVFINAPLRQIAVEQGVAPDAPSLANLLLTNFAESSVQLVQDDDDLDPIERWENWNLLINLADELDLDLDQSIVDLAQISLRRAQDAQMEQSGRQPLADQARVTPTRDVQQHETNEHNEVHEEDTQITSLPQLQTISDVSEVADGQPSDTLDRLSESRHSETAGITYYMPRASSADAFDDLMTCDRGELRLHLLDGPSRLEAAQHLLDRFGEGEVGPVLQASESMNAPQIAALSRFVSERAAALQGALIESVQAGGPAATHVAAYALAQVGAAEAMPVLIEALRDPGRRGDYRALAGLMSHYGTTLIEPLSDVIKRDGHDDSIVALLSALEAREHGTLDQLARNRNSQLRDAARAARAKES